MKEACKEVLRETLIASPALSITAYLSNCFSIQPKKKKWLPASFTVQVEAGAQRLNRSRQK